MQMLYEIFVANFVYTQQARKSNKYVWFTAFTMSDSNGYNNKMQQKLMKSPH